MIIFSSHITPRLQYIGNFFAGEMCDEACHFTSNLKEFRSSNGLKINYSREAVDEAVQIVPHGLLNEIGITQKNISVSLHLDYKIFFQNHSETGFDIFSAAFYLLSRYEEYLPFTKDQYGRFSHENSLAFKENFLHLPLINIWIENFKNVIRQKFPYYTFKKKQFEFLPTYDVDMAWAFQFKGAAINTAGFIKDIAGLKLNNAVQRIRALTGVQKDPYDTFDWLDDLHQQHQLQPIYFFLAAEHRSENDKNISPNHPAMRQLMKNISKRYRVGLHPSWQSNTSGRIIAKEKMLLEKSGGQAIIASRQHYLQLLFPNTYNSLIAQHIKEDYTMGYSGANGFRASVASPFRWYNLADEAETPLTVYPFCFMEATSLFYKKQTPEQALAEMNTLYNEVKKVAGFFSMIWHNSSLSNINEYKGWRDVYELFIKSACQNPVAS